MNRMTEGDDRRVGEATGEEGGERGRGAAVRQPWGELASLVSGGQRVGGGRVRKRRGKRHNLVKEGSGALRVASNRGGTGIRVRPRRTIRARG